MADFLTVAWELRWWIGSIYAALMLACYAEKVVDR